MKPEPGVFDSVQVMDHVFFLSRTEWKMAREEKQYDLVIVGTGFCGLATAKRALERDPHCRVLMIERGTFFLPEHFQNLPTPFVNTLGGMSETFPWTMSSKTIRGERGGFIRWQHGMVPFFGGRSTLWSAWCPEKISIPMASLENWRWARVMSPARTAAISTNNSTFNSHA